ncbi:MAG: hypothetical protein HQL88_06400 [Magnetococcales bacterium]|nr:hypothetical protein [Magnetococcales bacterium]
MTDYDEEDTTDHAEESDDGADKPSDEGEGAMELARRVVRSVTGGLETQAGKLIWKFAKPHVESLWKLLEQRLTTKTGSGNSPSSPALDNFKNNLNTPEFHALLTVSLRDALKEESFRKEVEHLLAKDGGSSPAINQSATGGDSSNIVQIAGSVHGTVNAGR